MLQYPEVINAILTVNMKAVLKFWNVKKKKTITVSKCAREQNYSFFV